MCSRLSVERGRWSTGPCLSMQLFRGTKHFGNGDTYFTVFFTGQVRVLISEKIGSVTAVIKRSARIAHLCTVTLRED